MRYSFVIVTCLVFCAISFNCTKRHARENKQLLDSITGTWELRQSSGGMMPGTNDYPPGNGNILKFGSTTYERYENGQLKQIGEFTIIEDGSVEESVCLQFGDNQFQNRIVYDENFNSQKIFLELRDDNHSNTTLSFITGCYALDGGSLSKYEKQ